MSQNDEEIKSEEVNLEKQTNQNLETEKEIKTSENNVNLEEKQNNINNETNPNITSSQNNNQQENNNYDYEKNKKEIMEKIEIRKFQSDVVEKYINETGIGTAFQIIFSELLSKKVPTDNYYTYTASRLRQIGREKAALERKNGKNNNK